jgi:hypothetical protein
MLAFWLGNALHFFNPADSALTVRENAMHNKQGQEGASAIP